MQTYKAAASVSRDVSGAHVLAQVDGRLEGHAERVGSPRVVVEAVTLGLGAQRQLGLSQQVRSTGACATEARTQTCNVRSGQKTSCTRAMHEKK